MRSEFFHTYQSTVLKHCLELISRRVSVDSDIRV